MQHTQQYLSLTTPPLKVRLSTLVDSAPLDLTSRLGKRRLFRHRIWTNPDSACPGWLQVRFFPGWLGNLPSGRVVHVRHEICREGELEALIERTQKQHGVHLWHAPISTPTVWPRGNWLYLLPNGVAELVYAPKLRHVAGQVAA